MSIACYIGTYVLIGLAVVAWGSYEAVKREGEMDADIVTAVLMFLFWPVPLAAAFGATLASYATPTEKTPS